MDITLNEISHIINIRNNKVVIKTLLGELIYSGIFDNKALNNFGDYIVIGISVMKKLIYTDDEVFDGFYITVRYLDDDEVK